MEKLLIINTRPLDNQLITFNPSLCQQLTREELLQSPASSAIFMILTCRRANGAMDLSSLNPVSCTTIGFQAIELLTEDGWLAGCLWSIDCLTHSLSC